MFPRKPATAHRDDLTEQLLVDIDTIYLTINRNWYPLYSLNANRKEISGSKTKHSSNEQKVLIWLQHIQRYFLTSRRKEDVQEKDQLAQSIVEFLKQFKKFPTQRQGQLCSEPRVFNCLVLTLMFSRSQEEWKAILAIMSAHVSKGPIWEIVDWLFRYNFEDPTLCPRQFLRDLVTKYNSGVNTVILESTCPAALVFQFLHMCSLYPNNAENAATQKIANLLPGMMEKTWLEYMPFIIELGTAANEFTHDLPLLKDKLQFWGQTFLDSFRIKDMSANQTMPLFYGARFQIFIKGYLAFMLNQFSDWDNKSSLLGFACLIQFFSKKPYMYSALIIQPGTMLCRSLTKHQQYTEAYIVYDDLLISWSDYESEEVKSARLGIYCYFSKIDNWLQGIDQDLVFSDEQSKFLAYLAKVKELLPIEYTEYPFYDFAQRLATRSTNEKDKVKKELCLTNYQRIAQLLTKDQQKEINKRFNPEPEPKFSFTFGGSSVVESSTGTREIVVSRQNLYAFFAPDAASQERQEFIHREQLPGPFWGVMDKLIQEFPAAYFYLVGGATVNILDDLKPNDYDLLAVNVSLEEIKACIEDEVLLVELRSPRNPCLYCDLGQGLILEFSARKIEENQTLDKILNSDCMKRDFNLNALYCQLTKEPSFLVFSFGSVLKMRSDRVITCIPDSEHLFKRDPTLLFRLVKLIIQYPNYVLSPELQQSLHKMKPHWQVLYANYTESVANKARLSGHIFKLFERYSYEILNNAFEKLGLLTLFSGNSLEEANGACAKIPSNIKGNKLLYWMCANILQGYQLGHEDGKNFFQELLQLSDKDKDCLQHVYNKGSRRNGGLKYFNFEFILFAQSFSTKTEEQAEHVMEV